MSLVNEDGFDLNRWLCRLREEGVLTTIGSPVNREHELAAIAKRYEGKGPVLFERVEGHEFPVVVGLYWNRRVLAELFGVGERELPDFIADAVRRWAKTPVSPVVVERGLANEVVMSKPDLTMLPVPKHFPLDGGPYLLSSVVIAKDPDTGVRNASVHRFMVTGPARLTMLMDVGRHLRDYYERAEKKDRPLEITISNGMDPTVYIASVVPGTLAPIDAGELGVSSELLGRPVCLVKSRTVGVEGVANAQFVIEGEILPHVREPEGPCAEVTGYYGERAERWVVNVKAITHRRDAIFHTLLPGREVYNSVGLVAEANVCRVVSSQVPGVRKIHFPHGGCGFYKAVVQIRKRAEGEAKNALLATLAAFPSLRIGVAVDEDVDIYDPEDVDWAICTRFDPDEGLILVKGALGHELNPMNPGGIGAKLGIDATAPVPRPRRFERARVKTGE